MVKPLVGETMKYGLVDGVYLVVHDQHTPSQACWDKYVSDMERGAKDIKALFVYSGGGGPNATQRSQVTELWKRVGSNPPTAVALPSSFVRGAITALNFFLSKPIRAFDVNDLSEPLEHLGVREASRSVLIQIVNDALRELSTARASVGG